MFKCYNGTAPKYLSDLVIYKHNRHLRSESARRLPIARCKLTFVQNSFSLDRTKAVELTAEKHMRIQHSRTI